MVYIAVEKILFDLFCGEVMYETFDKHIAKYFDTSNTADKVGAKLLFINAFMAPIPACIQRQTNEAVPAERIATKMKIQLMLQTLNAD